MNTLVLAALSIGLSVAAQFALKAGVSTPEAQAWVAAAPTVRGTWVLFGNAFVLAGLVLYALGALAWLGVLARWDVSKSYPLVGAGFAVTVVCGMLAGEAVSAARVVGVALICGGVWIVARS